MLFYFLLIAGAFLLLWFLVSYWNELKYRNKPFYTISEIGWRQYRPPRHSEALHSIALIGDAGNTDSDGSDPVLRMLEDWMKATGEKGTVVFLGDNIYPVGLPPEDAIGRAAAEKKINCQLELLKKFPGRKIYLSGNHDWNKGRKNGYEYLLRQEKYFTEYLQDPDSYLPRKGCPGPVSIQLLPNLLLVVINTQWWVQKGPKPLGQKDGCCCEDENEFFTRFADLLRRNRHQRIVVTAHHPLYSNALHGGEFSVKQHIFPLTAAFRRFYLPLPVAGSLYPLYRKIFGAAEDMSHPRYKNMRRRLLNIIHQHDNIIYAAGHDHNLQYLHRRGNHYIVSGSGSKTSFVKKGGKAVFTHECKGFFVLDIFEGGEIWMRVLEPAPAEASVSGTLVFHKQLTPPIKEVREAPASV